jgi:hypothetical protein
MKRIAIIILSIGWLLPSWLGISTLLTFVNTEVWPLLRGEHPSNSFPFFQFSARCFEVSIAWLAAALGWWVWMFIPEIQKKREPNQAVQKRPTSRPG